MLLSHTWGSCLLQVILGFHGVPHGVLLTRRRLRIEHANSSGGGGSHVWCSGVICELLIRRLAADDDGTISMRSLSGPRTTTATKKAYDGGSKSNSADKHKTNCHLNCPEGTLGVFFDTFAITTLPRFSVPVPQGDAIGIVLTSVDERQRHKNN